MTPVHFAHHFLSINKSFWNLCVTKYKGIRHISSWTECADLSIYVDEYGNWMWCGWHWIDLLSPHKSTIRHSLTVRMTAVWQWRSTHTFPSSLLPMFQHSPNHAGPWVCHSQTVLSPPWLLSVHQLVRSREGIVPSLRDLYQTFENATEYRRDQ